MHRNFYGPDSGYHDARRRFVYKEPATATPAHLALHRAMPDSSSTLRTSTTT
jgi:putative two-component system hydrogenase maturation factor HypX/HoxX